MATKKKPKTIQQMLHEVHQKTGLSWRQLAIRLSVDPADMCRWQTGEREPRSYRRVVAIQELHAEHCP